MSLLSGSCMFHTQLLQGLSCLTLIVLGQVDVKKTGIATMRQSFLATIILLPV
jgi:hypothetical protein